MARVKKYVKSSKRILAIIISVMLSIGAIFGIGAVVATVEEETQKTISQFEFKQGVLISGVYDLNNKNGGVYTEKEFMCDGLEVEIDFENDIEYEIHFYDKDGVFKFKESLDSNFSLDKKIETQNTTTDYTGNDYKSVRTCRIVIIPENDTSVAFYEVQKYAKQLTIKVNKVQFPDVEESSSTSGTTETA